MDDRIAELLAQYDVVVYRAGRIKGAWILETDQGMKQLGSCSYSEGKVRFEQRLKEYVTEQGFHTVDQFVPSREGNFLVQGPYNEMFVMRNWFSGEECDAKNREHVLQAVRVLARLHCAMHHMELSEEEKRFCRQPELPQMLEKRNKELRRVRTYIRSKKQKSFFEQKFLSQFDMQYAMAEQAGEILDAEEYREAYRTALEQGVMLHGNYTHHSIQFLAKGNQLVTGFERAENGIQIPDFYLLFRKMMEKWDWDVSLGDSMISEYDKIRRITEIEWKLLKVLLVYPEKFWKVANQYYNNRKSWIPEKNMQKLLQTMEQADRKEESIRAIFP